MVLTEFNEKVFVNSIKAEGRVEGQNDLVKAIERIRGGETVEDLIKSGVDEHTANLAFAYR